MKPRYYLFLSLFLVALFCSPLASAQDVVVSIKPAHSLVQALLGDENKATLLIDGNQSPHGAALKPSQMKAISKAKLVVYVDKAIEGFMPRALSRVKDKTTVVVLSQIDGVRVYKLREGGVWEAHAHHDEEGHDDHGDHDDHDDHKDHKDKHDDHDDHDEGHTDHDGHDHAGMDPHVWLDPANAQVILDELSKVLGKVYPQQAAAIEQRAVGYKKRLTVLDAELKAKLKGAKAPYVVFHDAYQYFEKRYGLNAQGSITLDPHDSPSVKRIKAIRHRLASAKVGVVFREPQFSDKLIKSIVGKRDIAIHTIDPLGAAIPAGAEHYVTLLTQLGKSLDKALSGSHDHHDH